MLRLKQLPSCTRRAISHSSQCIFFAQRQQQQDNNQWPHYIIPPRRPTHFTSNRFFDFYQLGSKAAIEKERARLNDEMSRGYFADMSELKQHGGKIALANKIIIPAMAAVKFPELEVNISGGGCIKLPIMFNGSCAGANESDVPKASLLCLSFRASSQGMANSWIVPFLEAFSGSERVQLYEVSIIESWLLSRNLIKKLLLRFMKKSNSGGKGVLQRQMVYSFGDHYYFRKELRILNLLTGYMFLLDKFGRIRWQGSGMATPEELSSLLACTSLLLEEN